MPRLTTVGNDERTRRLDPRSVRHGARCANQHKDFASVVEPFVEGMGFAML